jgi:antitoxin (DNA-binding transcriptional repressor) of toxin-antitoxin stability system
MNVITATELRTQTKQLVEALLNGEEISVVHRSKIIGTFKPKKSAGKPFNSERVAKIAEKINVPRLTQEQREKNYRSAMMKKHGKDIH